MTVPFVDFVTAARADIDAALDRWLPTPPACPPAVAEAMRYAVCAGGKRFRPLLTLAAAEAIADLHAVNASQRAVMRARALPAACAIELVHTQSLVHDDLPSMDDDVIRRGQPTVHVKYGEGLAILVGDALLAEAFGLLARQPDHDGSVEMMGRKLRVLAALGDAVGACGMVGGQAVDLQCALPGRSASTPFALDVAAVTEMHARKTGGLVRVAAVAGAEMAGADDQDVRAIAASAAQVGLAFQIVDDVLDVEASSETLGKTAGKDARAGKPTFASLVGCAQARAMATEALAAAEAALDEAGMAAPHLRTLARRAVALSS